jgi:hypothetical protein
MVIKILGQWRRDMAHSAQFLDWMRPNQKKSTESRSCKILGEAGRFWEKLGDFGKSWEISGKVGRFREKLGEVGRWVPNALVLADTVSAIVVNNLKNTPVRV